MLIRLLIAKVLAWLHGITRDQWLTALGFVHEAEVEFTGNDTGAQKKAWVVGKLQSLWTDLKPLAINLLVELAVSFIKKA